MAYRLTKEDVLEAIKGSGALITTIQKRLEAATGEHWNWETVKNYIEKWESCQEAVKAEKEAMLDLAENNVFKELISGDIHTSKWYLKMKGKERGYVETQEIQMSNQDPLNINLTGETMTAEELAKSCDVEVTGGDQE